MARPKNEENRDRIARSAYRLFLEQGYEATTYQAIADSCGIKRALVQHYFPSKTDLAIAFFTTILNETVEALRRERLESGDGLRDTFLVGQVFFTYFLRDESSRRLILDIIVSRALTEEVLAFNYRWGMDYLGVPEEERTEEQEDDIVSSMGGFYEYLYRRLKAGEAVDVERHLGRVIATIADSRGGRRAARAPACPMPSPRVLRRIFAAISALFE
jgi:Transcriptional regulator